MQDSYDEFSNLYVFADIEVFCNANLSKGSANLA